MWRLSLFSSNWFVKVLFAAVFVQVFAPPASGQSASGGVSDSDHSPTAKQAQRPEVENVKLTKKKKKSAAGAKESPAARTARTAQFKQAFIASNELRPMAQQLATLRTPAAYAGVANYARQHTGEAAAAAYLALGHAYMLDKKWSEAIAAFEQAQKAGSLLADYASFLEARSAHEADNQPLAESLLRGFAQKYPESIFNIQTPELEAQALLAMEDARSAQASLAAAAQTAAAGRPGFQLAQGEAALMLGDTQRAGQIFKRLLLSRPLTNEAKTARAKLSVLGAESSLTSAELRTLAEAYYNAHRYQEAAEQYRALIRKAGDEQSRRGYAVAEAACALKLKTLSDAQALALADTQDENGARRLYLLMELARNRSDGAAQQRYVEELKTRFSTSPWLAEALFSSGNMYLLKRDYAMAAGYYGYLAEHFPGQAHAATAHWRSGWLSYRQGLYPEAARIFEEQVRLYPTAPEAAAALYWRGRLYETMERKPAAAAANYRSVIRAYPHYYYAQMARLRLAALGEGSASSPAALAAMENSQSLPAAQLTDSFPRDNPYLAKARLLANAGLNEYIAQEIESDPESTSWSALAEAQIYASFGEHFRAMRTLKRALPHAASSSLKSMPLAYWRILYPEAWWDTIKAEAAKNHLDPYLVASLIRQESEFNPGAVSHANAYGLMQMLPSVGKMMAREEGVNRFDTFQLIDPEMNIRLGTRYLRKTLDKFGGVTEYALAAYNAGDERVRDWQTAGSYKGLDEFVESIPFTETREYVQAILRNVEIYKEIDAYAASQR